MLLFLFQKVELPNYSEVFGGDMGGGERFVGFCHLYFRIATSLGAFQELGRLYFDVLRDSMFNEENQAKV